MNVSDFSQFQNDILKEMKMSLSPDDKKKLPF